MMTVYELIEELERREAEKLNTAEECFQELGDEDGGNRCLEGASVLRELIDYLKSKL